MDLPPVYRERDRDTPGLIATLRKDIEQECIPRFNQLSDTDLS